MVVVGILAIASSTIHETMADEQCGRVIYNLDCTEYFVGTFGPIVPETIDKFVDAHVTAGISDLFINVNAQRTNYRSDVWEAFWDGYDPSAGVDQLFLLESHLDGLLVPMPTNPRCSKICLHYTKWDVTIRSE